jgi:hypothetical protein
MNKRRDLTEFLKLCPVFFTDCAASISVYVLQYFLKQNVYKIKVPIIAKSIFLLFLNFIDFLERSLQRHISNKPDECEMIKGYLEFDKGDPYISSLHVLADVVNSPLKNLLAFLLILFLNKVVLGREGDKSFPDLNLSAVIPNRFLVLFLSLI